MAGNPYASSLGRLKPYFSEFIGREAFPALQGARDLAEFTKILEGTAYNPDLVASRAAYQGAALVEVAVNRTLVRRIRFAYSATPHAGRGVVGAYLSRWDIQNISLILSSKAQDRSLVGTDEALVSSREIPAGLYAGVIPFDDLRGLMAQPTVEAVANALVRYGYGATILPLLEGYQRTGDIFPILAALEREYYRTLLSEARFFKGDEWVVREIIRGEIDIRNTLLLLKAKAADGTPVDEIVSRWIDGGNFPSSSVSDLYSAATVPALAERLKGRYPSVLEGDAAYSAEASLAGYEAALMRDYSLATLERVRSYPLSLGIIFHYLLRSELERRDLHRIAFGLLYKLPADRVAPFLVCPRL